MSGACTQDTTHTCNHGDSVQDEQHACNSCEPAQGEQHATTHHALVSGACTQDTRTTFSTRHACSNDSSLYDVEGTASTCERFWRPQAVRDEGPLPPPPQLGLVTVKEEPTNDTPSAQLPTPQGAADQEAKAYADFIAKALQLPCPLGLSLQSVPPELQKTLKWIARRTSKQVRERREMATLNVEHEAKRLRDSGENACWLAEADHETKAIFHGVNGPLGELLARTTGFEDLTVMEPFRRGWGHPGQASTTSRHRGQRLPYANLARNSGRRLQTTQPRATRKPQRRPPRRLPAPTDSR